mmetsp:Transcript_25273/g.50427  ORF Transcript_25273/g.50427 Transcript_25273/m.50427 type:complete len:206 (+) Transcript_25273:1339-1956(+)
MEPLLSLVPRNPPLLLQSHLPRLPPLHPHPHRIPHLRRPYLLRIPLPPKKRPIPLHHRILPPPPRQSPRRTHLLRLHRLRPLHPILDLPRLLRPGRRLLRLHRLREGLPTKTPTPLGSRGRRRRLRRSRVFGATGSGRPAKVVHRRKERGGVYRPGGVDVSGRLSGGDVVVWDRGFDGLGGGHAQVRIAVPRRIGGEVSGGGGVV